MQIPAKDGCAALTKVLRNMQQTSPNYPAFQCCESNMGGTQLMESVQATGQQDPQKSNPTSYVSKRA